MMGNKTTYNISDATVHVKAFTGTAAATDNGVGTGFYQVRVYVSDGAHIAIGKNPTATTSDTPLGASGSHGVEYFSVSPGDKVSAIGQSGVSSGTLYVTECTA